MPYVFNNDTVPENTAVDSNNVQDVDFGEPDTGSPTFPDHAKEVGVWRMIQNNGDYNSVNGTYYDANNDHYTVDSAGTYTSPSRKIQIDNSKRLNVYSKLLTPFKTGFASFSGVEYPSHLKFLVCKVYKFYSWNIFDIYNTGGLRAIDDDVTGTTWQGDVVPLLHFSLLNSVDPINSTDYFFRYTPYSNNAGHKLLESFPDSYEFLQAELDSLQSINGVIVKVDLNINNLLDSTLNPVDVNDPIVQGHFNDFMSHINSLENYWQWRINYIQHPLSLNLPQAATQHGWWDDTFNSGNTYEGYSMSKYLFESRAELLDITGHMNDFTGERLMTENFDLIFHIAMTPAEMNHAFANFGMPTFQSTANDVHPENSMDPSACMNSEQLRQFLIQKTKSWYTYLNSAITTGSNSLHDVSGQLTSDTTGGAYQFFDASGKSVKAGQNVMENWREMLHESGLTLAKYFGHHATNNNKVITINSVKKSFETTATLERLFPLSDTQLRYNALDWRMRYWAHNRYTPFTQEFTNKMSIAFPTSYTVPEEEGSTRTPFGSKIEFHVV